MEHYIFPPDGRRKLKVAQDIPHTAYIFGATGFGKTELVRQFLGRRRHIYLSCADGLWDFGVLPPHTGKRDHPAIVVIDDLHRLHSEDKRQEVVALAKRPDVWLLLISRSPVPSWLMPCYVERGFVLIREADLCLGRHEVEAYMTACGVTLDENALEQACQIAKGNAYAVRQVTLLIQAGMVPGPELRDALWDALSAYVERYILSQWDSELVEFLMQVSVVDEFNLELAEMISGNRRAVALLEQAGETGSFLICENGVYRFRPVLQKALVNRCAKLWGTDRLRDLCYNAALYYEMHDQIVPALRLFERCGKTDRIRNLLIRNARRNPGNGHYFELRRYYLNLKESDIDDDPILMAGMSMLYSLLMQRSESEAWYNKLKAFAGRADGALRREAVSRLTYLDIALPHRGSGDVLEAMEKVPALLDKGIKLPEFSVTSNMPSTMNGGKDFCHWSEMDRQIAATAGPLVEQVLGRYGKGIMKAALGESLYEKGGEMGEILPLLTQAQIESESGGVPEITFAAVGIRVRLTLVCSNLPAARAVLDAFEQRAREQGAVQLLPNIAALRCRLSLYEGDQEAICRWLETAPSEDTEFCILERYRYLTKVRCYLSQGEYMLALALLERRRYYAEQYRRPYIRMEVGVLSALAKHRMGMEWKGNFLTALRQASGYGFLRLISEEGADVRELLRQVRAEAQEDEKIDRSWLKRLLHDTEDMALRYPVYLNARLAELPDFPENALAILRLQADGLSNSKIAERLGMNLETVKYHAKLTYKKLGVSGKAEAVLAARDLGLL